MDTVNKLKVFLLSRWQITPLHHKIALVFILTVTCFVRAAFLFQPIRYDEAFTFLNYASKPLSTALSYYPYPNNHVFHTLWVHLSTQIFGIDPWAIRLPAFIAGILIVPAIYFCAYQFYKEYVALLVAALTAVSSPLIEYATNARGYTLLTLIFIVLFIMAYHLQKSEKRSLWLWYGAVSALGIYTIPTMVYALAVVDSWLLFSIILQKGQQRKQLLKYLIYSFIITSILTVLLYLPIILTSGVDALTGNTFVSPTSWKNFISQLPHSLEVTFTTWHRDIPVFISLGLSIGFVTSIVLHKRISKVTLPPALPALVILPAIVIFQQVIPFTRVWLFLIPLYLMSASAGVFYLLSLLYRQIPGLSYSIGIILLCLYLGGTALHTRSVYFSDETGTLRSAEAITDFLKNRLLSTDAVLVSVPGDKPLQYYFYKEGIGWKRSPRSYGEQPNIYIILRKTQTLQTLLDQFSLDDLVGYTSPELVFESQDAYIYQMRNQEED